MEAHDLAELLLKLEKGTKVYIHSIHEHCYGIDIKTGEHGNNKVAIFYPNSNDHIGDDFVEFDKKNKKM